MAKRKNIKSSAGKKRKTRKKYKPAHDRFLLRLSFFIAIFTLIAWITSSLFLSDEDKNIAKTPVPASKPLEKATHIKPDRFPRQSFKKLQLDIPEITTKQTTKAEPDWLKHAVQFTPDPNKKMIAIVIDDLGIDKRRTARTIAMDSVPLTLAFLPYASRLKQQTRQARRAGHELLIHMPMQPMSETTNPGPGHLRIDDNAATIRKKLYDAMHSFDGYVGINNHMGSRFTQNKNGMDVVVSVLKDKGLLYLDSMTIHNSHGAKAAKHAGIPNAVRHVFLDHEATQGFVRRALQKTERYADKHGYAIAIGHPKDTTLDVLEEWIKNLDRRGYQIVPLTSIVKQHYRQSG